MRDFRDAKAMAHHSGHSFVFSKMERSTGSVGLRLQLSL
jgi:hypothetical protein